ncbi:hypothetical protein EH277_00465 [Limosilactobacillus fermentum]|nr:hypothetical protein EH277_00465 [Limosilactobacillus fermentum]
MLSLITFISPVTGLVIMLTYFVFNYKKPIPINIKKFTIPVAICFAQYGYSITSTNTIDLNRYYDQLLTYSGPLNSIIKSDSETLYTRDVLFYLVNRTGDSQLLTYIVGFVIYGIAFYVLFDLVEKNRNVLSTRDLLFMIMVMVCVVIPANAIGNVRNITAYMLISFATYRDIVQKKRNLLTLFLYIVPLMLHSAAVFMLIIRILQGLVKKIGLFSLVIAVFLPTLINVAYEHLAVIPGSLLKAGVQKAYSYLNWTDGGWATAVQNSMSDRIGRLYGIFFLIVVIGMILYLSKKSDEIKVLNEPMVGYILFVAVCALGCLYITTGAFWRFEAVVTLLCPVYLVPILRYGRVKVEGILRLVFLSVVVMAGVNMVILINNFEVLDMIAKYIVGNGVTIVIDLFRCIML